MAHHRGMSHKVLRATLVAIVAGALAVIVAMPPVSAQSASRYREFELGGNLASISALAGTGVSEAKTIHSRPAVMQELRWQRPYSAPSDAVQQITFSFYNDQLSKMVVDYDRDRTAGMTDADLVEALSESYGAPSKPAASNRSPMASQLEQESGTLVARWLDPDRSVALYRASYASAVRLIVTSPRLEGLARTAIALAARLDEREAPRREIERQKKEADDARVVQEKARLANKAAFRP